MKASRSQSGAAKPSAASRTVDMFSGLTQAQEQEAIDAAEKAEDLAESEERPLAKPIEEVIHERRSNAFRVQEELTESLSKNFRTPDRASPSEHTETFRISTKGVWMFLETLRHTPSGPAYFWSGVMFRADSLYELTGLLVKHSRERQAMSAAKVENQ